MQCNADWIRIALLFASWTTSPLRSIPYQTVQRSSHWNQEATNHRAFFAITSPRLAQRLRFLLNCERRYILVPIWWFLLWGRQKTLMQYSWTTLHESAHRSRSISQAILANSIFVQQGIAWTLLRRTRSTTPSSIATQMSGRGIPFRLKSVGRLHQARSISDAP